MSERGRTATHTVDRWEPYAHTGLMASRLRTVTVNLPADLVDGAIRITARGLTPTIIEGFELALDTTRR